MARITQSLAVAALLACAGCGILTPDYHSYTAPSPAPAPSPTTGGTVTYSGQIQALLSTNCVKSGCHDAASALGPQQPDLSTYAAAKANAGTCESQIAAGVMPLGSGPLSSSDRQLFQSWITAGTPQ